MEIGQKQLGFDIETQPCWIGKNEFPFTGTIKNVEPVRGKYGKTDYRLELFSTDNGTTRNFDVWGDNLNYLVNVFGPRADGWLQQCIRIERGPDLKRVVHRV